MKMENRGGIKNIIFIAVLVVIALSVLALAKVTVFADVPTNDWKTTATNISFVLSFTTVINGSDGSFTTGNFSSANCTLFEAWTNQSVFTKNITTGYLPNVTNSYQNISAVTYTLPESDSNGYEWYWNCSNATVSESVVSTIKRLRIDSVAPSVRNEYPTVAHNLTPFTSSDLRVNFTVSDRHLKSCDLIVDKVYANLTNTNPNNGSVDDFGVITLADGQHLISMSCIDLAGNKAGNATNVTVDVDTAYPTIVLESPNVSNLSWINTPINVTFVISDLYPANCSLYVDNGNSSKVLALNQSSVEFSTTANRTNFSLVSLNTSAIVTESRFQVRCMDTSKHTANSSILSLYADTSSLLNVSMEYPANGSVNPSRRPTLQWTASVDKNFLNYRVNVMNRSGTILATTNITSNGTVTWSADLWNNMSKIGDGWVFWNVSVFDKAGNYNSTTEINSAFKIDGSEECFNLSAGWNYCGLMVTRNISAGSLASEIGSQVTQIAYYNASKALITHVVGTGTNNFAMGNGTTSLLIYASSAVEWNNRTRDFRTDEKMFAVTLTNASTGSSPWNYYSMQNQSGMTFAEMEMGFSTLSYNYTADEGVVAVAKVNLSGIYSYILGTGKPWNRTFVDYGEGTYYLMGNKNVSLMWNFTS